MELSIEQLIANLDQAITEKKIEAIKPLYDENASLVKQPGDIANGLDEITGHYQDLFSLNIPMTISTQEVKTVEAENLALITSKWTLEGTDPEGNKGRVEKVSNMVAAKSDRAGWRILIENPFGPELLETE